ncbi:ComF family protein [Microbacterium sp. A84]|uniref:ComF family protein n=1 Tax=Microbacterium sp. A84 TaxID=3450715 RepID=UPI003F43F05E
MWNPSWWVGLADELAAFLLSGCCAGCDAPGTLLCAACTQELIAIPVHSQTPEGIPVVSAFTYESVAARCIRRVKEDGETLLTRPLGTALAVAVGEVALGEGAVGGPAPLMVPMPTGRAAFRRRGYRVPELLMRRAGLPVSRILTQTRRTADQRGLDIAERGRNVSMSMRARHARESQDVLLFDDVVTTGATLDEAARALREAGYRVCGAVTLAATPKHQHFNTNTS